MPTMRSMSRGPRPVPLHAPPAVGFDDVTYGYVPWSRSRNVAWAPSSRICDPAAKASCNNPTVSHTYGCSRAPNARKRSTTSSTSIGLATRLLDQGVLGDRACPHGARERFELEHLAGTDPHPPRLVGVGRARCPSASCRSCRRRASPRRSRRGPGATGRSGGRGSTPVGRHTRSPRDSSTSISWNSVGRSTTTPLAITGTTCSYSTPLGTSCRA